MATIDQRNLDATLDRDQPVLLQVVTIDEKVRDILRRRRPLLFVETLSGDMTVIVDALRPHVEILIDRLIRAPDLVIGDDLQQVIDLGLYNPKLGLLFETLWLARFEFSEHRDFTTHLVELVRTTFDDHPLIRNDALLFWLTLLRQNEGTAAGQVILMIARPAAGLDAATETFIRAAEHWEPLGSPVRIVTDALTVS